VNKKRIEKKRDDVRNVFLPVKRYRVYRDPCVVYFLFNGFSHKDFPRYTTAVQVRTYSISILGYPLLYLKFIYILLRT